MGCVNNVNLWIKKHWNNRSVWLQAFFYLCFLLVKTRPTHLLDNSQKRTRFGLKHQLSRLSCPPDRKRIIKVKFWFETPIHTHQIISYPWTSSLTSESVALMLTADSQRSVYHWGHSEVQIESTADSILVTSLILKLSKPKQGPEKTLEAWLGQHVR